MGYDITTEQAAVNATLRTAHIPGAFWTKHNSEHAQQRITKAEQAGNRWCSVCGNALRPENAQVVRIIHGGSSYLHPEDEARYTDDGGDMGSWDLGPECARMVPAAFRARAVTTS